MKLEKEKFTIPKSVQDAIPIQRIWPDGIFQVGSRFSKTFSFTDINYSIASKEDKTAMFLDYSELLNALDSGASAKITINNRKVNKEEFEKSLLLPMKEDGLDHYRKEYNEMLLSKVSGTNNSVVQDRYITITVAKRNIDEARTYFSHVGTDLINHLSQLSSIGLELDIGARLQIFRDFFKGNEPAAFAFDLKEHMKKGHSVKDWLCPDSMEFQKDHFRLNDRWGRVLYLQDYASYIKDSMIAELCDMDRSLMLSIDILTVPTDEAVREIQNKLLGVETNAANWQCKQNAANNFSAVPPYDMEQQRKETKEMLDDLTNRDQRMMFGLVTLVHLADAKEQLDSDTETLLTTARKHLCQMSVLRWQQKDGLDTVLPYGLRRISALRTLTTESTAVLIPFRAQEILQGGGIYYGQNAVSKNMIVADRRRLLNGNSFRLGVSGSGKSFSAKGKSQKAVKTASRSVKGVKQSAKGIKTAQHSAKTAQQAAKAAQKAAQATAKAAKAAAQAAKTAAKAAVTGIKVAVKATATAIKAAAAAIKGLVAAIAAGDWVAVVIILLICLIALIVGSCFGLFFGAES